MKAKAFLCSSIAAIFPNSLNTTRDTQQCAQPLAVFNSWERPGRKRTRLFDKGSSLEQNAKRETMENVDWEHQTTMYKSEIEFT